MDNRLTFDHHVSAISKSCFFHIRAFHHIRAALTQDMANSVAVSLVTSRLDYANSLLFGTSQANLNKLQRIQNTLAKLVDLSTLTLQTHSIPCIGSLLGSASTLKSPHPHLSFCSTALLPIWQASSSRMCPLVHCAHTNSNSWHSHVSELALAPELQLSQN